MDHSTALNLKREADELFGKKLYTKANSTYSEAIELDPDNAVLYCNRSACSFALGRYIDASSDARKATELDPNYVKAWGRLAMANQELGSWDDVVSSYKKALDLLLEKNDLSAAEKGQQEVYTKKLEIAKTRAKPTLLKGETSIEIGQRPWDRAKTIIEALQASGTTQIGTESGLSSAYVIYEAYLEFDKAYRNICDIAMEDEGEHVNIQTKGKSLEGLSNAVLRDRRVFYVDDTEFFEKYHAQVIVESEGAKMWASAGPDAILKDAQERVKNGDWTETRIALSVTVRAWIMKGFFTDCIYDNPAAATQFFVNAIDLLTRGRSLWPDVSKAERGTVFEETFIMGVRMLHMITFLHANAKVGNEDERFSISALEALAKRLISDIIGLSSRIGTTFPDEGFMLSFIYYPLAEAYSVTGYCLKKKAVSDKFSPDERAVFFGDAAVAYKKAAQAFPQDDEYHCQQLMRAASCFWSFDDIPIKIVHPILAQLKATLPNARAIWENSAEFLGGLGETLDNYVKQFDIVDSKLQSGELNPEQAWPAENRIEI